MDSIQSELYLPDYSPSLPAPRYSYEPACDEQRLQLTPSSSAFARTPASTYIKKSGKTTVVFTEQEVGVELPTYGRHGPVAGTIVLDDPETVTDVEVKIEGKIDATISEAGGRSVSLLRERHVLWSKRDAGSSTQTHCPSQLPFAFILPTTVRDGDEDKPLPPSYHVFCYGASSLFLKTTYSVRVSVTRVVHQKLGLWTRTKNILIPFKYYPRTRAHRPILPLPCFFSSIKTSPEEWYQAVSSINPRKEGSLAPVSSHLFIPAGRVYGVTDSIPFHLQLSGPVSSLREIFAAISPLDRVISTDSTRTDSSSSTTPQRQESKPPIIRVYLMRQVTVELRGSRSFRNVQLGEGTLTSLPPSMSSCYSPGSSCREEHLDWEGVLRCDESVTTGGFALSNIQVKDFVMLNVAPSRGVPSGQRSQMLDMQVSVPIRLVTDSYGDMSTMPSQTSST